MTRTSQDRTSKLITAITGGGPLPPWREQAACLAADPEQFYPEPGDDPWEALYVCNQMCTVRDQCLDWALRTNEQIGVWGGTTPSQRQRQRSNQLRKTA